MGGSFSGLLVCWLITSVAESKRPWSPHFLLLKDCPKNFIFALEASLLDQIFIFRTSLSRGHYQLTYQPPEGFYFLNRQTAFNSFELFVRESLVTILEHQDEAEGNKDTTEAPTLKAKQMKLRYCDISVYKNNSWKRPDPKTFWIFRVRKGFSLPRTYTYVLDSKACVR